MVKISVPKHIVRLHDTHWLPCHDIGPAKHAPRLALVANLHGDDLNGLFVLSRLATFLRSVEAGRRPSLQLRERVVMTPTADRLCASNMRRGMRRMRSHRRMVGTVLDRVLEITRSAYYRVEVRSADGELEELPQVWLHAPSDDERASACLFGLPAVIEQSAADEPMDELLHAWQSAGGENFIIHAGQAGNLQTEHCEKVFRALVMFLDRIGIIAGLRLVEDEEDLHYFDRQQVYNLRVAQSGIFSSTLDVGCWVRAGEVLGQIYDSFTGKEQVPVIAPVAGLLAGLRRRPLLCEGDLVARILIA